MALRVYFRLAIASITLILKTSANLNSLQSYIIYYLFLQILQLKPTLQFYIKLSKQTIRSYYRIKFNQYQKLSTVVILLIVINQVRGLLGKNRGLGAHRSILAILIRGIYRFLYIIIRVVSRQFISRLRSLIVKYLQQLLKSILREEKLLL